MFNCFPDADAWAQAWVGPGLATPLFQIWAIKIALKSWYHHGNINTNVYAIYTRGSVQLE